MIQNSALLFSFDEAKAKRSKKENLKLATSRKQVFYFCGFPSPKHSSRANALLVFQAWKKSIRETVPTFRVELIVSTFPVISIFSVSPTFTYTNKYIYLHCVLMSHAKYIHLHTFLFLKNKSSYHLFKS